MKPRNRYFVVNRWLGKGGHVQARTVEYESHQQATAAATRMVLDLLHDSGNLFEDVEV